MKKVVFFIGLLILTLAVPPSFSFFIYKEVSKRTRAEVQGQFSPVFFSPSFNLSKASIQWDDKVRISSGDLHVEYSPLTFLKGGGVRIKISGVDLPVQLMGSFAGMAPKNSVTIQDFYADVTINKDGLQEIHMIRAEAPEMHFKFGLANNIKA